MIGTKLQHPNELISLFDKEESSLREAVKDCPSSSLARYLLLKKLKENDDPGFEKMARITALYFNNPPWLTFLLNTPADTDNDDKKEETSNFAVSVPASEDYSSKGNGHHDDDSLAPKEGPAQVIQIPEEEESSLQPATNASLSADLSSEEAIASSTDEVKAVPSEEFQEENPEGKGNEEYEVQDDQQGSEIEEEVTEDDQDKVGGKDVKPVEPEQDLEQKVEINEEPDQQEDLNGEQQSEPSAVEEVPEQSLSGGFHSEEQESSGVSKEPLVEGQEESPSEMDNENREIPQTETEGEESADAQKAPEESVSPVKSGVPEQEEVELGEVPIEPMHTVDYFAALGIHLTEEDLNKDKLGRQLKSFTGWLKSMKKLHSTKLPEQDVEVEKIIQRAAEISNMDVEVLTEAMAEVLVKQGKVAKAIEMFEKLSLTNPSKSAYFAGQIEKLKQS